MVNVLKKSMSAIKITKHILGLNINPKVRKLLALAFAIKKQLIRVIFENKAIQFRINFNNINNFVYLNYSQYFMGSAKIKIRFRNNLKTMVFLDTRAKINVMTRKVMKNIGLVMRKGFKLDLMSNTGHKRIFLRLYEDVKVIMGKLKLEYLIFVIKHGNHNMVLG